MIAEQYRGANVLVTGGLGFIGSHLVTRLVKSGAKVTVVDSLIPDYGGNLYNIRDVKELIQMNISDVRDAHAMEYLVGDKDFLFNLAGQVSHIDSMNDPLTDMEINARGQLMILEACKKKNRNIRVLFTSTRQVYGRPQYLPVDEHHPLAPTDVNGVNKLAGEWYHLLYDRVYGVRSSCLRLTNTYGPHQLIKHSRQGFIGWFLRQIVKGEQIKIFGTGEQIRDFNYVDDVCDAMLLAAVSEKAWGKVYNLGSDERVSLKTLVELMISIRGAGDFTLVPFPEEKKKIDIGDFYGDYKKIREELGWHPKTTLADGISRTISFYAKHYSHYVDSHEDTVR